MGDLALTYDGYCSAASLISKIQQGNSALRLGAVLSQVEAELNEVLPGFSSRMVECWDAIQRQEGWTLPSLFAALFPETSLETFQEYDAQYCKSTPDEEHDEPEEEEEEIDLEYLPRVQYLQFREIYFRLSGNDVTFSRRSRDVEVSVLQRKKDVVSEMVTLFDSTLDVSDHKAFKRLDKDRTGTISPAELLRSLLPNISKHNIKHAMRQYEASWKEFKQQLLDDAREAKAVLDAEAEEEEAEEGEGEEEEGEPALPEVVTEQMFLFCKEAFEGIDSDGSGSVSHSELVGYLEQNPSPFTADTPCFKAMDKDRSGYVSFLEFVRALHPTTPAWKVKKDIALNEALHGAVAKETTKTSKKKPAQVVLYKGVCTTSASVIRPIPSKLSHHPTLPHRFFCLKNTKI